MHFLAETPTQLGADGVAYSVPSPSGCIVCLTCYAQQGQWLAATAQIQVLY